MLLLPPSLTGNVLFSFQLFGLAAGASKKEEERGLLGGSGGPLLIDGYETVEISSESCENEESGQRDERRGEADHRERERKEEESLILIHGHRAATGAFSHPL